jgi:uncharacterized membrane protein YeaQ/YmgE (transglycosylase-associated protein family)
MGLCSWIVFGFLAGLVARAIMPGTQRMGFIRTTVLGVGGAFVGGALGALLRGRPLTVLEPSGFIGAVIGALVLLVVGGVLFKRSHPR